MAIESLVSGRVTGFRTAPQVFTGRQGLRVNRKGPCCFERSRGYDNKLYKASRVVVRADGGQAFRQNSQSMATDDSVPEGHKELHAALYGDSDNAADEHDSRKSKYAFVEGEDDGSSLVPLNTFLSKRRQPAGNSTMAPPMGVFAIYDQSRALQYVSYSRNITLSVRSIAEKVGDEKCAFVRNMVFANAAMQTRQAMEKQKQNWIDENGTVPPGNGIDKESWEIGFAQSAMSESEKVLYDDQKSKMVAAMGQTESGAASATGQQRREKLKSAVEGGDWSQVIEEQTQATIDPPGMEDDTSSQPVTTPFVQAQVHRTISSSNEEMPVMTKEAVDKALDDVRPYLIADGGDVQVLEVDSDGRILLQLQGACGSCAASSSTMKMGIERCLIATFGDQVKEVIEVGGATSQTIATVASVDAHINGLRGAIGAYGGSVTVSAVDPPVCSIDYVGPKPLAYGLVAALKDKFPELTNILVYDGETGDIIDFDAY
jgi:Fe-S cluster biogenesis protein NfuA